MSPPKRKISVTVDADLLAELERAGGSVSAQLNEALRAEVRRRREQVALQRLLDDLEAEDGPLDTPEDLAEMARIERIFRALDEARDEPRRAAS